MKICITGSFGCQDIGDDAMLEMHLANLDGMGVGRDDVTLVGNQVGYMREYFDHERCRRRTTGLEDDHDCLIVTGGGTINTRDRRGRSLRKMHALVKPFAIKGRPIFMSGQTIGPLGVDREHDALARELVGWTDVLTVRDRGRSRKCLDLIGAEPKELIETIDDAAHLPYDVMRADLFKVCCESERIAAVNTTPYTFDTAKKRAAVVSIVRSLVEEGWHILFVPHTPADYCDLRDRVVPNVPRWSATLLNTVWATGRMRSGSLKRAISLCGMAVGGRYHFLVFAMSAGVPCVGMAGNEYSYVKQMGFAEQMGCGDYVTTKLEPDHVLSLMGKCREEPPHLPPTPASFDRLKKWLTEIGHA